MNLNDLLTINSSNLTQAKHDNLKEHVIKVLENILLEIDSENYENVENMLFYTIDSQGHKNYCIDFGFDEDVWDMGLIIENLQSFKKLINNEAHYYGQQMDNDFYCEGRR